MNTQDSLLTWGKLSSVKCEER